MASRPDNHDRRVAFSDRMRNLMDWAIAEVGPDNLLLAAWKVDQLITESGDPDLMAERGRIAALANAEED